MTQAKRILEEYYAKVSSGQFEELLDTFEGDPSIDTPLHGLVQGRQAALDYFRKEREWLFDRQPGAQFFSTIDTEERVVVEYLILLQRNEQRIELPVAVLADKKGNGFSQVRVYHTTWMTRGMHTIRDPLLTPRADLDEPEIVQRYMKALAAGDLETVLSLFADYGYVREPSGSEFKHVGRDARRQFYERALAGGGIPLQHCTATFDGRRCAIEYIIDRWGGVSIDPQPGVAVYELDAGGRLGAVRIYDDIAAPRVSANEASG
jgi:ketosteroid isomerase-like protein